MRALAKLFLARPCMYMHEVGALADPTFWDATEPAAHGGLTPWVPRERRRPRR
jgi:hypothetical protein